MRRTLTLLTAAALLAGPALAAESPSAATLKAQAALKKTLPFKDQQDFDFATRGYVGTLADPIIRRADGGVAWDLNAYAGLEGEAPATVNPSLWRHAQLLAKSGLFQVSERIWQVRGFDVANATFIQGDTGWIVIDPLTTAETARAALQLANEKLGARPVVAIIYTHSHADHFGGVKGMVSQADVDAGKVQVIAPEGFLEEAVSENVIAGPAMSRRAMYQFGYNLAPGPEGQMSVGIGKAISKGAITLIAPTRSISKTGETLTIDGVRIEFQITPGTEAPAEMNMYFPDWKVLDMAENANATMHNVLTPRGALVRDAKAWADYLTESRRLYGDRTDIMITSHGWPRFGGDVVRAFLRDHSDAYRYLHDQTVRLMNRGYVGSEIANRIELPPTLADSWFNRGYYGTMSFNSRAVYQRYMGWYDANPASLAVLDPADQAERYVEAMGGAGKVKALAKAAHDKGDYRWAATLLNNVVTADPQDREAREALAGAYDQMGWQAESSLSRNMYLTGAAELRATGPVQVTAGTGSPDIVANLPSEMIFDLLAIRLDPEKVGNANLSVVFVFPERKERFLVRVRNRVLTSEPAEEGAKADATLTVPRALLLQSLFTGQSLAGKVTSGEAQVDGNPLALMRLTGWFDRPAGDFPIVTRPE
ncbi:MAG TPA: alkyl sulfatase dimerization domain-containing protein [Caulobacter sp.]|nr:alkyl sulfatase dimerization domain-containing protein [Caulobacter sp.]